MHIEVGVKRLRRDIPRIPKAIRTVHSSRVGSKLIFVSPKDSGQEFHAILVCEQAEITGIRVLHAAGAAPY